MPQANLTDVQNISLVIPNGDNESAVVNVTHNLQDQNGNDLTPDRIHLEVGAIASPGGALDPVSWSFMIGRSSPEDGTFAIKILLSADNNTGDNITFTVRVVSDWIHSIQSDDHTP